MAKKSRIDEIVDKLQAEIDERQKMIAMLLTAAAAKPKRERKPRIKAVPESTAQAG